MPVELFANRASPQAAKAVAYHSVSPPLSCHWGEAHFVYHPESGQTHFVNQSCAEVLALIQQRPCTTEEIYAKMLTTHGIDEDSTLRESVESIVELLVRLGVLSIVS